MGSRVLTVSSVWTHTTAGGKNIQVPFIRLQGKWLEKLGVEIGSKLQVSSDDGEITIKLLKDEG